MVKRYRRIKNIIIPNKKLNLFIISILFLGIIAGAIYVNIINLNDRNLVIEQIKLFIDNINTHSLNHLSVFKNSIQINLVYVFIIWLLGMALIGIITNIIILFLKGFIFGFSIASFIVTYGIKGIILSFIYLSFGQLLNILVILLLTIYSFTFSIKILKLIFNKDYKFKILTYFKSYLVILTLSIIISIISSISETFILPALIKLIIKLFVN